MACKMTRNKIVEFPNRSISKNKHKFIDALMKSYSKSFIIHLRLFYFFSLFVFVFIFSCFLLLFACATSHLSTRTKIILIVIYFYVRHTAVVALDCERYSRE